MFGTLESDQAETHELLTRHPTTADTWGSKRGVSSSRPDASSSRLSVSRIKLEVPSSKPEVSGFKPQDSGSELGTCFDPGVR